MSKKKMKRKIHLLKKKVRQLECRTIELDVRVMMAEQKLKRA